MIPQWDEDAEQSLLGAMMLSKEQCGRALGSGIKRHHFYSARNAAVFGAIEKIDAENRQADALSVCIQLGSDIDTAGGEPYVRTLPQLCAVAANALVYANEVKDKAALRRLRQAGQRILEIADGGGGTPEKLAEAEQAMNDAVSDSVGTEMRRLSDSILPELKELAGGAKPKKGRPTGFDTLDQLIGGLRPGKLITVAARPGLGKTTLGLNIVRAAAAEGAPAAIFSMEMTDLELSRKMLASLSLVPYSAIKDGEWKSADYQRIQAGYAKLTKLPIFVDDLGTCTMTDVRAKARVQKRRNGTELLMVDYLQLMAGGNPDNRNQAIGEITRSMKLLAHELGVTILLLSQMNRAIELRKEKRPTLSDLRDSGAIEQDSDVVMFVHRPDAMNASATDTGVTELIVAKNREGEQGVVNLSFVGSKSVFKPVAGGGSYAALGTAKEEQ